MSVLSDVSSAWMKVTYFLSRVTYDEYVNVHVQRLRDGRSTQPWSGVSVAHLHGEMSMIVRLDRLESQASLLDSIDHWALLVD